MTLCYRLSSHPWPNRWHWEACSLYLQVRVGTLKPVKRMQPRRGGQGSSALGTCGLSALILRESDATPGNTCVWRHFWLSQLTALPTSSMLLPGKLLAIPQHRGQPHSKG